MSLFPYQCVFTSPYLCSSASCNSSNRNLLLCRYDQGILSRPAAARVSEVRVAVRMSLHWEKLSPAEFQQLQDFSAYSSKKLEDVLKEFTGTGTLSKYSLDGDIDYEGFRQFMDTYLEVDTPEELCRHLFLSFVKRPRPQPVEPKSIKEMAVMSSATACAPITSHNTSGGSISNLATCSVGEAMSGGSGGGGGGTLAEKLHGLTEKFSSLGHNRSDSEASSRTRTGSIGACVHPWSPSRRPTATPTGRWRRAPTPRPRTRRCQGRPPRSPTTRSSSPMGSWKPLSRHLTPPHPPQRLPPPSEISSPLPSLSTRPEN
ncbi:putative diacylglycerol kinase 1 [Penaeus vannamei]|uniref:Putative diacylglycerol kinase 1 n=1 Tax=Penaeus vannamei TaxID=6689 RepID=A0A3R7MJF3_PENVA|nr:putative diacylglycerol kinase 1 [Penaeus vannamei]